MATVSAEKIREAYKTLPAPIREFLVEGELGVVVQKVSDKYGLHVDTMGILADSISRMLLGFISPQELSRELTEELKLDPETTKSFIGDLNTEVFVPLQKRVKEEGAGPSFQERVEESTPEEPPPAAPAPPPPVQPAQPAPAAAPPPPQPFYPQAAPPPMPPPAPAPPIYAQPYPAYAPPQQMPAYAPPPAPTPIYSNQPYMPAPEYYPATRTMAGDMELAAKGINPQMPAPQPVMPPPPPVYAQPAPPPPPPRVEPAQSYPPPTMASVRLTPVDRPTGDAPIRKEYGSDPYREPIE